MTDIVPKIADIATLKGISMLLALPMLCVAYAFQTGIEINVDGSIWWALEEDDTERFRIFKIVAIFILKSLWISFWATLIYAVAAWIHFAVEFPILYIISVVLIAFALLGIFGAEKIPELKTIDVFWYYSFIIWGVFLQTMREKLDETLNK